MVSVGWEWSLREAFNYRSLSLSPFHISSNKFNSSDSISSSVDCYSLSKANSSVGGTKSSLVISSVNISDYESSVVACSSEIFVKIA